MAKSKGKRKRRNDSLVLQLMILVAIVLVVFEGKLVITMVTHRASTSGTQSAGSKDEGTTADGTETEIQQDKDHCKCNNLSEADCHARNQHKSMIKHTAQAA